MQNWGRKSGKVKAGDIIGYQGDSGNLGTAISRGKTVSHVHIAVEVYGQRVDPLPYLKTRIDIFMGIVMFPSNCN